MANSEGSEVMLNRVMTKDNIGVAVLLELRKEIIEQSGLYLALPLSACILLADTTEFVCPGLCCVLDLFWFCVV